MDIFSLLFFRLDSYIMRIKELYSYIFRFFLSDASDNDDNDGISGVKKQNKITL